MTSTRNEGWTLFKMVQFAILTLCPLGERYGIVVPDKDLDIGPGTQ